MTKKQREVPKSKPGRALERIGKPRKHEYQVVRPFKHDGQTYQIGENITGDKDFLSRLIRNGYIKG